MDEKPAAFLPSQPGRRVAIAGLIVSVIGLLTALVTRLRSVARPVVLAPEQPEVPAIPALPAPAVPPQEAPPPPDETPPTPVDPPLARAPVTSPLRVLLYVAGFFLVAGALLVLPRPWSTLLFIGIIVGWVLFGLRRTLRIALGEIVPDMRGRVRPLAQRVRPFLQGMRARWQAYVAAHRNTVARASALLGLILIVISVERVRPENGEFWREETSALYLGMLLLLLGGVAIAFSLRLRRSDLALPAPAMTALTPARIHWYPVAFGLLLLWAVSEANGELFSLKWLTPMNSHVQFLLLVGGTAFVVWGLSGFEWRDLGRLGRLRIDHAELWIVILLTAGALFLRFYRLEDGLRVWIDEGNFVTALRYFWFEDSMKLIEAFGGITAFPRIYPYWQAQAVEIFGHNLAGVRAVSAIFGALTVPAVYWLGRASFDRMTGVLAAVVLMTFPPHLHFSRLGINNIADPFFGTLAVALLVQGVRSNRRVYYALGGVALGLTQWFYEGGRLLFVPLILVWLTFVAWRWRRKWDARGLLIAVVAAVIIMFPVYYTLLGLGQPVFSRMQQVGFNEDYQSGLALASDTVHGYLRHFQEAFFTYFHLPEGSQFYSGSQPLMLPLMTLAAFLGFVYAVARWRATGTSLALLWVVATAVGNSLLVASVFATRFVVAFPALALLAAVGIRYVPPLIWEERRVIRQYAVMLVLALALGATQVDYYFNEHLPMYNITARPGMDGFDAIYRSLRFPQGTQIHLVTDEWFGTGYAMLVHSLYVDEPSVDVIRPEELTTHYLTSLPRNVDHAFFMEPEDYENVALLRSLFTLLPPTGSPYPDIPANRAFQLYYAPCCMSVPPLVPTVATPTAPDEPLPEATPVGAG
ncbi:MAG: glycosyltransferase family 39 protein [Anaerolineae bacterium]|nr:glycosyltransferase family 39 protein [Anaerolineae bacterium]